MLIIWLGFNVIIGTWLIGSILSQPLLLFYMRKFDGNVEPRLRMALVERLHLAILAALFTSQIMITVGITLLLSVHTAVVVTSLILYISSLTLYFIRQRFAGPLDQARIVTSRPLFYPKLVLTSFLAQAIAVIMFYGWLWVFAPIITWYVLGFICAELAIRKNIKNGCDRQLAIFTLNSNQGRTHLFSGSLNRYPFP